MDQQITRVLMHTQLRILFTSTKTLLRPVIEVAMPTTPARREEMRKNPVARFPKENILEIYKLEVIERMLHLKDGNSK